MSPPGRPKGEYRSAQHAGTPMSTPAKPQPRNPLHGLTLEAMLTELVAHFGWADLGTRIQIKSFNVDASIASSLKFLRKTPWAREKVEGLYLFMLRDRRRSGAAGPAASS